MRFNGIGVSNCNILSQSLDCSYEFLYLYQMCKMIDFKKIQSLIENAKSILLTTHENPDGDGLGCCAAIYHYLKELEKDCRVITYSELPSEYGFLNSQEIFEFHVVEEHQDWITQVDLVIVFDVGNINRLRSIYTEIKSNNLSTLNIDHHPLENADLFTYNYVDISAAATGEIIYNYLKSIGKDELSKDICEGIYTAILTDTGSFRHSNTNTKCHKIAIECFRSGINHSYIYQQIYESNSKSKIKLLGTILSQLHYECDNELAWFTIDQSTLTKYGATKEDVGGFTDFVRTIHGVEVSLMIFENGHDTCRINYRSKGKYQINGIAKSLGGGGHPLAAGAVMKGKLDSVLPEIIEVTRQSLEKQKQIKE